MSGGGSRAERCGLGLMDQLSRTASNMIWTAGGPPTHRSSKSRNPSAWVITEPGRSAKVSVARPRLAS